MARRHRLVQRPADRRRPSRRSWNSRASARMRCGERARSAGVGGLDARRAGSRCRGSSRAAPARRSARSCAARRQRATGARRRGRRRRPARGAATHGSAEPLAEPVEQLAHAHRLDDEVAGAMPTSLSRPLSKALAETIATGAVAKPSARSRRIVSQPSMPGIARSIRIASGAAPARSSARPPRPSRPAAARSRAAAAGCTSSPRSTSSLSTTSMRRRAPASRCARARGSARSADRAPRSSRQEQADREAACPRPGVLLHRHLAAHQVGQHLRDRQARGPVPPAAACAGRGAALERLEHARQLVRRPCRARSPRSRSAPSRARSCTRNTTLPRARELDRVAEHVDEDLAQPLLVGAHRPRGSAPPISVAERDALAGGLQLEHAATISCTQSAKRIGARLERQLAALDARDVQRALDQRQQVVAAAADHAHGLRACAGGVDASSSSSCA